MMYALTTFSYPFAIALALSSLSCAPAASEPKIDPDAWAAPQATSVLHTSSVAVTEGSLPLVYETTELCTVRVIDQSSGKQVAFATARPGQFLAISRKGAKLGTDAISDPLPADHRYTIFVDISRSEAGPADAGPVKK
jgi:hypothetical protein